MFVIRAGEEGYDVDGEVRVEGVGKGMEGTLSLYA